MNRSETIGKLGEALAKAQRAFKPAVKSAENPFFKSKYADLQAVWEVCREGLAVNGLSVVQGTILEETSGLLYLETFLAHTSGEWISSVYPIRPVKEDPQGIGSAVTYARRYALSSMVGIVTVGEDDDANVASGHEETKPKLETPKIEKPLPPTPVYPEPFADEKRTQPKPVEEMDRKGWERLLYTTATLNGMVDGKDDKDRPKVDFKALGHWLKNDAGFATGYIKDLTVDQIKMALDVMREMYAKGISKKIDEQEANGDLGAAANKSFDRFK